MILINFNLLYIKWTVEALPGHDLFKIISNIYKKAYLIVLIFLIYEVLEKKDFCDTLHYFKYFQIILSSFNQIWKPSPNYFCTKFGWHCLTDSREVKNVEYLKIDTLIVAWQKKIRKKDSTWLPDTLRWLKIRV